MPVKKPFNELNDKEKEKVKNDEKEINDLLRAYWEAPLNTSFSRINSNAEKKLSLFFGIFENTFNVQNTGNYKKCLYEKVIHNISSQKAVAKLEKEEIYVGDYRTFDARLEKVYIDYSNQLFRLNCDVADRFKITVENNQDVRLIGRFCLTNEQFIDKKSWTYHMSMQIDVLSDCITMLDILKKQVDISSCSEDVKWYIQQLQSNFNNLFNDIESKYHLKSKLPDGDYYSLIDYVFGFMPSELGMNYQKVCCIDNLDTILDNIGIITVESSPLPSDLQLLIEQYDKALLNVYAITDKDIRDNELKRLNESYFESKKRKTVNQYMRLSAYQQAICRGSVKDADIPEKLNLIYDTAKLFQMPVQVLCYLCSKYTGLDITESNILISCNVLYRYCNNIPKNRLLNNHD